MHGVHIRCFSHTLQLVIRDALRDSPGLKVSIAKAFKIAVKAKNSQKLSEELVNRGHKSIPLHIKVRWNSELKTIRTLLRIPLEELNQMLAECQLHSLRMMSAQYSLLKDLVEILDPYEEITDILQGEKYCTISMVIPSIEELYNSTMNLSKGSRRNSAIKKFADNLCKGLKRRFNGVFSHFTNSSSPSENYADYCYLLATTLDPAFRFYWIDHSELIVEYEVLNFLHLFPNKLFF